MDRRISYKSANIFYEEGAYKEALGLYLDILKMSSPNERLLILIANCYDYLGDKKLAIEFYRRAYADNPESVAAISNMAIAYYDIGEYSKSKKCARKTLENHPTNVSANLILGNIFYQDKSYQRAIQFYQRADKVEEPSYTACVNIANSYIELREYENALGYAKKAHKLEPSKGAPFSILGNIYKELSMYDNAVVALEKAIAIDDKDPWTYNYLSQAYQELHKYEDALRNAYFAVKKGGNDNAHHLNFGYLLYEVSGEEKNLAESYAKEWLEEYPSNETVYHMANSVLNNQDIDYANEEYLKNVFDVFAEDFDDVLSDLEYRAPKLVYREVVKEYGSRPRSKLKILDAGCGTGLCGKYLKKYAKWFVGLHGVDLSPEMLKVARRKRIYNSLHLVEITNFLSDHFQKYDLIVSSDVFTYFGDLKRLFSGVNVALKQTGRVIFTVSENYINNEDYHLHKSGRFLHSKSYIENLIAKNGLMVERISREKLRNEGEKKVYGFVVTAVKKKRNI